MDFAQGHLVVNPHKPEWGPGKVLQVTARRIKIVFRDVVKLEDKLKEFVPGKHALVLAEAQADPLLDPWGWNAAKDEPIMPGRKVGAGGRTATSKPKSVWSQQQALDRFLNQFPGGFNDPGQIKSERGYKWVAHELFQTAFSEGRGRALLEAGQVQEIVALLNKISGKTNLLHSMESTALRDGLKDDTVAARFAEALLDLLDAGPVEEPFEKFCQVVRDLPFEKGKTNPCTWPVVTLFPFLAKPSKFMFLKPESTQCAAERLNFNFVYSTSPNWTTYKSLCELADRLLEELRPYGANDYMDVQTFIYVTERLEQSLYGKETWAK